MGCETKSRRYNYLEYDAGFLTSCFLSHCFWEKMCWMPVSSANPIFGQRLSWNLRDRFKKITVKHSHKQSSLEETAFMWVQSELEKYPVRLHQWLIVSLEGCTEKALARTLSTFALMIWIMKLILNLLNLQMTPSWEGLQAGCWTGLEFKIILSSGRNGSEKSGCVQREQALSVGGNDYSDKTQARRRDRRGH